MAVDYKSYDFQIYEYLIRLRQALEQAVPCREREALLARVAKEQERIKTRRFRVAVVGEFKRGKSSFINALLGQAVLPVDASPTTATINRITYGAVPRACLCYKDGSTQEVEIGQLADYVTKLTGESKEQAARIREAVVEYPSVFCQNYVDLIDTPGMNDDDTMNQVTVSKLDQIDLAIVAVSANLPFGDTECNFMVQLLESPEICQIVVVVTYIDSVRPRERERLLSYLQERICGKVKEKLEKRHPPEDPIFEKYRRIFGQLKQFGVSSVDALEARDLGDMELLEESGFLRLNKELPKLILGSQNNSAIEKAMAAIEEVCREYEDLAAGMPVRFEQRQKALREQRTAFARMAEEGAKLLADSARVRMYGTVNQFAKEAKAEIIQGFIRCLSGIRQMDADVLDEALKKQRIEAFQETTKMIRSKLDPQLRKSFWEEIADSSTQLSGRLRGVLAMAGVKCPQAEAQLAALVTQNPGIRLEERAQPFGWDIPLTPAKEQLLQADIIRWVKASAERSLDSYARRRKEAIGEQLDGACARVSAFLKPLVQEVGVKCRKEEEICAENIRQAQSEGYSERLKGLRQENAALQQAFLKELLR